MSSEWQELLRMVRQGRPVRAHSGRVGAGDVFVALPGVGHDGSRHIPEAVHRGASVVVAAEGVALPEGARAALVSRPDVRLALGELARAAYGTDALPFPLVGVTGTNGKTTITYLVERLFSAAGRRAGVLGTVSYRWPGHSADASMTTPDCLSLHAYFAEMAAAGVETAVMEVSSHAIDQLRVAGLDFDCAVLSNVTQDHLDYHGDMETYFRAKERLFRELPRADKAWVVNYEDPYGARLLDGGNVIAYGLSEPPADLGSGVRVLRGTLGEMTAAGLVLSCEFEGSSWRLHSPLVGRYNAMNLLAAQGAGLALGLTPADMAGLGDFLGVPGRLERVPNARGRNVFVDYAHTPDALENMLAELSKITAGRLLCVFGCGGNRDRAKRPLMGAAVCRYADTAVLTSDNPRNENPLDIIEDVKPGLAGCARILIEVDRRAAIGAALAEMRPEDVLVIAGKGHETYQIIGDTRLSFSDAAVAAEILACA